jgi:hypothetical protein
MEKTLPPCSVNAPIALLPPWYDVLLACYQRITGMLSQRTRERRGWVPWVSRTMIHGSSSVQSQMASCSANGWDTDISCLGVLLPTLREANLPQSSAKWWHHEPMEGCCIATQGLRRQVRGPTLPDQRLWLSSTLNGPLFKARTQWGLEYSSLQGCDVALTMLH